MLLSSAQPYRVQKNITKDHLAKSRPLSSRFTMKSLTVSVFLLLNFIILSNGDYTNPHWVPGKSVMVHLMDWRWQVFFFILFCEIKLLKKIKKIFKKILNNSGLILQTSVKIFWDQEGESNIFFFHFL